MAKGELSEERRRHKRQKSRDIAIKFDGKKYNTADLSIGGTLIGGYDGPLSAGALLTVTEIGPAGGKMKKVTIRARVNRADAGAGQLALTFLELDTSAYEILQDVMARKIEALAPTVKPDQADPVQEQN